MDSETKAQLGDVFCDVLQNLSFMFAELQEAGELPPFRGEFRQARMGFMGPFQGALRLVVPAPMTTELAANMLGLDPDDEETAQRSDDALRELLNVTCGHVLTTIAGEGPVFDLTIPEVSEISAQDASALAQAPEVITIVVDDNPVVLQVVVKR